MQTRELVENLPHLEFIQIGVLLLFGFAHARSARAVGQKESLELNRGYGVVNALINLFLKFW